MKPALKLIARGAVTLALVVGAAASAGSLWQHYHDDPWTRDGRVRADVVQVAPDVSGLVDQVLVRDNQVVHRGDVLFTIDKVRPHLALTQAEATVRSLRTQIAQAEREDKRNLALGDLVPGETREQGASKLEQLQASLAQAAAAVDTARVNLERTEVRASVDGWVTNFDLRPGAYATAGKPMIAVVDQASLHVLGYFEETKIARIAVGDRVHVRLVGDTRELEGHVDSIAAGIDDRERSASSNLLANVNPTFNWVRLAQRIPVRVQLDRVPSDLRLIMGRTATVEVLDGGRRGAVSRGA